MSTPPLVTAANGTRDFASTERNVAALWNEVLRTTNPPQPTDNFFDVGGDSMAMITLEFRITEQLGVDLTPGTIFSTPTLRELATLVNSLLRQEREQPQVASAAAPSAEHE